MFEASSSYIILLRLLLFPVPWNNYSGNDSLYDIINTLFIAGLFNCFNTSKVWQDKHATVEGSLFHKRRQWRVDRDCHCKEAATAVLNQFCKFIMLGTPNHGSPVARLQHIIPRIYEEIFCSSHLIGMIDELDLGSGFLDLLNYGVQDVPSEGNWSSDCGTHGAEWLYGLDRNHVYCIGGTSPCGTVCEKVHPFICGDNDGIVSTRSAYLWAIPPGNFWLDTQLRDAAGQVVHADHFQSDCSYSINPGIAKAVREILDGDPPAHIDRASAPETQSVDDPIQLLPPLVGTTLLSAPFTDTSLVTPATQAVFQCYWKDVPLSYAVVSPGGVVIDEAYAETSPLVLHIATDLSSNFIVQDPETGNWAHQVNTTSAVEPDSLWILVSHDSDIVLEPSVTSGIDPHGSFDCSVALTEADAPIAGSSVSAAVRTPLGDSLELPLLDDGSGGDPVAGDGVFTATLGAAGVPGTYVFVFTGTGDIPGLGIFERVAVATGRAESLPNIAVAETGLRASTSESLLGLGVELACTFENTGAAIADTVRLQILSAEANAVVADTLVSMVPGQAVELRGDWHTNVVGTVSFAASANVIGAGSEVSYIDNGDSTSVLVGHPASGSTAVEAVDPSVDPENTTGEESPRVLHFKTYPNPFNPATKIRFEVQGGEAHVRLRIYDLRGQLVRTLIDRRLGRGAHERTWDARDNRGLRVSSGAYFCRIEVSSSIFTRKMMVVK